MPGPRKRKVSSKDFTDKRKFSSNTNYIFTFLLFISTLLIYDVVLIFSEPSLDLNLLEAELEQSIYGQNDAVSAIIHNLNLFQNQEHSFKVLNFVGSTGVGKTFAANLVKKYFEPNVFEIKGSLNHVNSEEILSKISYSNYRNRLIIIDDLTVNDIDNLLDFIKKVPQDVNTLIIVIFNIQETDEFLNYTINYKHIDKIVHNFEMAENINSEIIQFQEFNKDDARKWVINQINLRRVNGENQLKLADSLLEAQNVKFHGLKGLISKLNLEL